LSFINEVAQPHHISLIQENRSLQLAQIRPLSKQVVYLNGYNHCLGWNEAYFIPSAHSVLVAFKKNLPSAKLAIQT